MSDGFEKYGFPDGKRYNSFVGYFKRKYGERLQKIVLDAGFTCPNRDGSCGTGGCIFCLGGSGDFAEKPSGNIFEQIEKAKARVAHKNPSGKYIALCEGDDYWIDEYKLQKQFDYMQKHEHIRMCYTRTEILAPEDWHLNSYYKRNHDGRMIIPECAPGFKDRPYFTVKEFISVFPNHTS